jgi:hypothetical protein
MLKTFTNGSIEYFIDQERRVVFGRWEGDILGDELLAMLPELWRDFPEIGGWSAVYDMLDFTGILEHRHTREMMRLRTELVPDFNPQVRTAVVSRDPMKNFEIKVTKITAPDRQFGLFGSNEAALEWITADEPDNPSPGPRRSDGALPWWFDRKSARSDAPTR